MLLQWEPQSLRSMVGQGEFYYGSNVYHFITAILDDGYYSGRLDDWITRVQLGHSMRYLFTFFSFVNLVYNMTIYIEPILGMVEKDAKIGYMYLHLNCMRLCVYGSVLVSPITSYQCLFFIT